MSIVAVILLTLLEMIDERLKPDRVITPAFFLRVKVKMPKGTERGFTLSWLRSVVFFTLCSCGLVCVKCVNMGSGCFIVDATVVNSEGYRACEWGRWRCG